MNTDDGILEVLRRDGIAVLPGKLDTDGVRAFNEYLSTQALWEGHVRAKSEGRRGDPSTSLCTSWSMEDVILAPHFFEFAVTFFRLAQDFLGENALLYSLNAFTTYSSTDSTPLDVQNFHRDYDDSRFFGVFMLCSDVLSVEDGAHQYVKGSHLDDDRQGVEGRDIVAVTGKAGTAFLAATRGLHRGVRPVLRPRTLAWARWGISDPPSSYGWDKLSPVVGSKLGGRYPTDPRIRNALRLVVSEQNCPTNAHEG